MSELQYTGERVIPPHDGNEAQGCYDLHEYMYKEFLITTVDKVVIDVACGCGHGSKMIAEKAVKVFGYDIAQEAVDFAKEHNHDPKIDYNVGDIRSLPHEDASVDVVVSVETFEHVTEIGQVINEVKRVLKPGGLWCFTTPNGDRYPDHRVVKWHVKHYNRQHLHSLLDSSFIIHVRETGFEPDSTAYFGKPTFGNFSVFCVKK